MNVAVKRDEGCFAAGLATGAMIPAGCDTVAIQEQCVIKEGKAHIRGSLRRGDVDVPCPKRRACVFGRDDYPGRSRRRVAL